MVLRNNLPFPLKAWTGLLLVVVWVNGTAAMPPHYGPFEPEEKPPPISLLKLTRLQGGDTHADFRTGNGNLIRLQSKGRNVSVSLIDQQTKTPLLGEVWCGEGLAELAVAYEADLNGNGVPDYVLAIPIGGLDLPSEISSMAILLSDGLRYRVYSFDTLFFEPEDIIEIGENRTALVHTSLFPGQKLRSGRTHSFWIYNLLEFGPGGVLDFRNDLLDGFPKTIWYTFRPNHVEEEGLLTAAEKDSLLRQSRMLFRTLNGEGRRALDAFKPRWAMLDEFVRGDYVLRVYGNETSRQDGSFEVLHRGRRVWFQDGRAFRIHDKPSRRFDAGLGDDITGDGEPNIVVMENSGGSFGVLNNYVYALEERFRLLQVLPAGEFKKVGEYPGLAFLFYERGFTYWRTAGALSPLPRVPMLFQNGQYEFQVDTLHSPPLSRGELEAWIAEGRKDILESVEERGKKWQIEFPYILLGRMVDLVYSGNLAQAYELLDGAWPDRLPGKQAFRDDFDSKLRSLETWHVICALNGLDPLSSGKKKPRSFPLLSDWALIPERFTHDRTYEPFADFVKKFPRPCLDVIGW